MNVNTICFKGLKLFCFRFKQLRTILCFIRTRLKEDENTCNSCFKITSDIDKFDRMYVIWKDNSHYRIFANLWRSFAQEIMNKEDLIEKYGRIDVSKYNCKTTQALDSFSNRREPSSCFTLALLH